MAGRNVVKNWRLFYGSRLVQSAGLYNGQRYARTKEPAKTVFFRLLIASHSKYVCKGQHRRNPTAVRHRCVQRCVSENEQSAVAAKASTVL